MTSTLFLKAWAATACFFLIVDSIWLGLVARSFYRDQLGDIMRESVNFPVAALFYVFFSAATVFLASTNGLRQDSALSALLAGAILGLAAYGTYDITNLATIENWPVTMSIVDMIWGMTITASASYVGYRSFIYFNH